MWNQEVWNIAHAGGARDCFLQVTGLRRAGRSVEPGGVVLNIAHAGGARDSFLQVTGLRRAGISVEPGGVEHRPCGYSERRLPPGIGPEGSVEPGGVEQGGR